MSANGRRHDLPSLPPLEAGRLARLWRGIDNPFTWAIAGALAGIAFQRLCAYIAFGPRPEHTVTTEPRTP